MQDESGLLQRLGGYAVLLIVALILILGSRTPALSSLFAGPAEEESGQDARTTTLPDIAQQPALPPLDSAAGEAGEEAAGAEGFDISTLPVLVDNSLVPDPVALTYKPAVPNHSFITYTVKQGDTAIGIADQFNISEETILGGNEFLSNDAGMLQPGAVLTILPIDGVLHTVAEGESLESLSQRYGISVDDIIAYEPNNLHFPYRLVANTDILIPGAVREVFFWEPPVAIVTASSGGSPEALQGIFVANLGTGTFIWPIGSRNITQHYWYGHPGLDVAAGEGSAVYASDAGTVTFAAWSPYCFGNLIVINHGNGYETFYAHLSGINVSPGQTVRQGALIGASGNTGCSSGPHLHFEIRYNRGRFDPLSYLQ